MARGGPPDLASPNLPPSTDEQSLDESADARTHSSGMEQVDRGSAMSEAGPSQQPDNSHRTIAEWVEHIHRSRMEVVEMALKIPLAFAVAGFAPTYRPLNGRLTESEWQEHVRRIHSLKEEMEIVSGEVSSLRGTLAHLEPVQQPGMEDGGQGQTEHPQLGQEQLRRVRRRREEVEMTIVDGITPPVPVATAAPSEPVHGPAVEEAGIGEGQGNSAEREMEGLEGTAMTGQEGNGSGNSGGRKRLPWKSGMEFVEMLEARAGMRFSITRKFLATVIDRELEVQTLSDIANSYTEQMNTVKETMANSSRFSLVLDLICRHLEDRAQKHADRAKKARQTLDNQARMASNVLRGI